MPIHYGSQALNYHTTSSPLGVRIPQAIGVVYQKKLNALNNCQGHHSDLHQHRPSEEVMESERTSDLMKRFNIFLMKYGWLHDDCNDIA